MPGSRLARDFLMATLQSGSRVARRKARTGAAVLLAQGLAVLVYTLLALAVVLLLRVRYEVSLDAWIDGLLDRLGPGGGSGR